MTNTHHFSILFFLVFIGNQFKVISSQSALKRYDFYLPLELDAPYDIVSPNFPQNYPENLYVRWTVCAPYGSNIFVNCTIIRMPSSQYCAGDRLEISYSGCQDLNDGQRYCYDNPFVGVSRSNAMVIALVVPRDSPGGKLYCKVQAHANNAAIVTPIGGSIRYGETPINSYPPPYQSSSSSISSSSSQQTQYSPYPIAYPSNGVSSQPATNQQTYNPLWRPDSISYPTTTYTPSSTYSPYSSTYSPYSSTPTSSYAPYAPYSSASGSSISSSTSIGSSATFVPSNNYPNYQPFRPAYQQPSYQPYYQPSSSSSSTYQPSTSAYYPPTYIRPGYPLDQQQQQQQPQQQIIYGPGGQGTFVPVYQPNSPQAQYQPQCLCGMRKQPRIVGGVTTDVNEFPFVCGIIDMTTKRVICGCTIIHENYVLTAAHCVINQTIGDLGCLVGAQDYAVPSSSPYMSVYRFAAFIPYPNYDPVSFLNDIAIMRVYEPMQFNAGVSSVCLPISFRLNQKSFVYSQVDAVGWGKTSFGGPVSTALQKVQLTVIPNEECNKNYPYQITSAQMCTFTPLKDTCDFDDGGPSIFTDTLTGRAFVNGVDSYGVACGSRIPRVFTRITSYLSWIMSTTNGTATYCVV